MDRLKQYFKMSNKQFKRIVGTTKPVFREMHALLETAFAILHIPGGKPPDLTPGDKLLMTLEYYREYRTMERISMSYSCAKSSVSRSIRWVEDTLSADARFQLPGKRALQDGTIKTVAIDVTEHRIERPKKNRRNGTPARKSSIRSSRRSLRT